MTFPLKRELQVLAVSAGSLLLVGPLSYIALTGGAHALGSWLGTGVFADGFAPTALTLVAVVLSLLVASVAVDVQFQGFGATNGRGLRTAIDYAACWTVVLAGTIVAIDLAVAMLGYGGRIEAGPIVTLLPLSVLVALTGAAIRSAKGFRAGVRDGTVFEG